MPLISPHASGGLPRFRQSGTEGLPAEQYFEDNDDPRSCGLIRVKGQIGRAFVLQRLDRVRQMLVIAPFAKRRDFLHPIRERSEAGTAYTRKQEISMSECTVDPPPFDYALFAAFWPSILHRMHTQLLAQELQSTRLKPVDLRDTSLLIEAITSPAASESADYNRLEYLGDAILKFCAHRQVMAQHPTWPEGFLDLEKGRIVCNATLAHAALEAKLDLYILTKPFTGSKWRPPYVSEALAMADNGTREMSSKVLADVVEALIGAAMVDGGLDKAYTCIQTLLPKETWYDDHLIFDRLTSDLAPCNHSSLDLLEQLTGHHFIHPTLLVEATTHASMPSQRTGMSYERLEFLGDAVLDLIIVPKLFAHPNRLRHWQLHSIHETLVNGLFLGYCCMKYGVEQEQYGVVNSEHGPQVERGERRAHLHDFIRADGQLVKAKRDAVLAFNTVQDSIEEALQHGSEYPWAALLALSPPKFLSDIVESVLGALYIDTHGDLAVCERLVERLGIIDYMRSILDSGMTTMSPKERLGVAAGNAVVKYINTSVPVDDEPGRRVFYRCRVEVDGKEVAAEIGKTSKAEVEARAALAAIAVLRGGLETNVTAPENERKRKHELGDIGDDPIDTTMRDADGMHTDTFAGEST